MSTTLVAAAALVGLAGLPHCAAMCGAPCAAITGPGRRSRLGFLATRALGYVAAGALLAGSGSAVGEWARGGGLAAAGLRGVWIALHAAALAWGLAMLWQGRQPQAVARLASSLRQALQPPQALAAGEAVVAWPGRPRTAALAGALWWAWPCGLLQSALVLAVLGNSALEGAGVMAIFALTSSAGLWWGPALWRRLAGSAAAEQGQRLAVRAAGGLLALVALVALWHDALGERLGLLCL